MPIARWFRDFVILASVMLALLIGVTVLCGLFGVLVTLARIF